MKKSSGTLIELMIVIAIVGILAAVVNSGLSELLNQSEVL